MTATTPAPRLDWSWLTAVTAAVATVAVTWPVLAAVHGVHPALAMVIAVVHAASIVLTLLWPAAGIAGTTVAVLGAALLTAPQLGEPWPWPMPTLIAHCIVLLFIALRRPWHWAALAWLAGALVPLLAIALMRGGGADGDGWTSGAITSAIVGASVSAGVAAIGIALRALVQSRSALRTERARSAEHRARGAELAERNRIAQELHDVVAHSMSVISVQATTAEYRLPGMEPLTAAEFGAIADSSRRALSEMRGLLTILRGSGDAPLVPQPTLADIPELVDSTRQSSSRIDLEVVGAGVGVSARGDLEGAGARGDDLAAHEVPPATGLTVYRIVQEALSNAVRHSAGADILVRLELTEHEIVVDVVNGARPPEAVVGPAAPGAGLGLAGIRERVEALGGSVQSGPNADGGFAVHAELPLG